MVIRLGDNEIEKKTPLRSPIFTEDVDNERINI